MCNIEIQLVELLNMNKCSYHKIYHNGVAGGCPICMEQTIKEEKERIEKFGY